MVGVFDGHLDGERLSKTQTVRTASVTRP